MTASLCRVSSTKLKLLLLSGASWRCVTIKKSDAVTSMWSHKHASRFARCSNPAPCILCCCLGISPDIIDLPLSAGLHLPPVDRNDALSVEGHPWKLRTTYITFASATSKHNGDMRRFIPMRHSAFSTSIGPPPRTPVLPRFSFAPRRPN